MIEMLPKGWLIMQLIEIVNSVKTGVPEFQGEKEYYSTGSVQGKNIIPEGNFPFISKPSRANRIALKDDVFQARMKETDKGLIADEKVSDQLFSTGFLQLRPFGDTYSSKFLYYYVISPCFINQKDEFATGSTQEALTDSNAQNLFLPLPPLNEQKRIVTKLDQIIPRIEHVKERLDKIPTIIKRFRQSVLTAAVTGNLTEKWREGHPDLENGEERLERSIKESRAKKNISINYEDPTFDSAWNFLKLGVLFSKGDIFDGPFGSNLKTSDCTTEGVRVIRLENIEFLGFNNNKKTYISKFKYENLKRHTVFSGDIIFSSFISDTTRTVLLPELNEISLAKADCFCLRANEQLINKKYLTYILSSKHLHDYLQTQVHGATRPRINTTQLRNTPIPYPSLEEQKEIVRQVDKLFALADKLESHYQKAKARVDKLSQSILAKAFRGELVITEAELAEKEGRDFETAEKLLDRILEEKAKLVCSKKSAVKRKFVEGDKMVKKENRRNPK